MQEKIKKVFEAIQKLPENDLTKNIIIPTFERMSFFKVEFYGGTDEEGKDMLCWKKDPLGDIMLIVAQVKHFKFTNKASGQYSFQTIVNQLSTAFNKKVHFTDKKTYYPDYLYLISSKEIDSKNIKSHFGDFPSMHTNLDKLKIIDGYKLAELILENRPDLASQLIDEKIDLSYYSENNLTNNILLRALTSEKEIKIKSIYTDIDFSLGRNTTKLFFNVKYEGKCFKVKLNKDEWESFKFDIEKIGNTLDFKNIISNSYSDIENKFSTIESSIKTWKLKYNQLKEEVLILEKEFESALRGLRSDWIKYRELADRLSGIYKILKDNLDKELPVVKKAQDDLNVYNALKEKLKREISLENKIKMKSDEISKFENEKPESSYEVEIKGNEIQIILEKDKKFIEKQIEKFNECKFDSIELKEFLLKCKQIFIKSTVLLENVNIKEALGISDNNVKWNRSLKTTRFKLPINKIFNTGLNFAVLGEAGAGKTTSLQMYALENKDKDDRIILWLPLPKLVQGWSKNKKHNKHIEKIESFDNAICEYLQREGVDKSKKEILEALLLNKSVLLFDGLDESIKNNEWLPEAINSLAEKYKDSCQIIITSRMSGEYVEELDFLTFTLLPFTKDQRNNFINNWFNEEEEDSKNMVLNHFKSNPSIDEISRNPLLTTTLCVLARHKLPLPKTEIKLYDDRLKLLSGYYDSVKNIPMRVRTKPHDLEKLSRKIAYKLHTKSVRELELEKLEELGVKLMKGILDPDSSKRAIKELIDPCNILVPMSETGKYGFGHLRYQEHLAACELVVNRTVNYLVLMNNSWWKEALLFFSQMVDDLSWLTNDIGYNLDEESKNVLNEMIMQRPEREKEKMLLSLEEFDQDFEIGISESFL